MSCVWPINAYFLLFWWMEYGIIMMGCRRGIPEGRDWKNAQGSRPLQVASSSLTVCTFSKRFCSKVACILWSVVSVEWFIKPKNIDNDSRFHCSKKSNICLKIKNSCRGVHLKKTSCPSSERKKIIRASWKFPNPTSPPPPITFLMVRPLAFCLYAAVKMWRLHTM